MEGVPMKVMYAHEALTYPLSQEVTSFWWRDLVTMRYSKILSPANSSRMATLASQKHSGEIVKIINFFIINLEREQHAEILFRKHNKICSSKIRDDDFLAKICLMSGKGPAVKMRG